MMREYLTTINLPVEITNVLSSLVSALVTVTVISKRSPSDGDSELIFIVILDVFEDSEIV